MFDDQPINNNQLPSNLPIGEPEDIFASTDDNIPGAKAKQMPQGLREASMEPVLPPMQTAVGMGKLQPKVTPMLESETKITNPPLGEDIFAKKPKIHIMPQGAADINKIKGPSLAKNLMIFLIILIGATILGGGSWLVYSLFVKGLSATAPVVETEDFDIVEKEQMGSEGPVNDSAIFIDATPAQEDVINNEQNQTEDKMLDQEILFGEPVDADADNLSDDIELEIGTDPNNWDTDKDGLGDGDEVLVWRSNPLKLDTDGDGYSDGSEVKNGYSPIGPGRIFDLGQ